jgi:hypothetical protein
MIRIPCKAGGALLLVLTLAPSLHAGNHPSRNGSIGSAPGRTSQPASLARTTLTLAGVALVTAAAVADPGSTAALASAAPTSAIDKALSQVRAFEYGPVELKPMSYLCPGPYLKPGSKSDLEAVDRLVDAALQAYQAAGCEPYIAEKTLCIGPDAWKRPATARKLTAREYIQARYGAAPFKPAEERYGNQGEGETWSIEMDKAVCRALGEFQRDPGKGRHAALFQRLLEIGDLHERLRRTQEQSVKLNQAALKQKAEVEKEQAPKLNLALAKERMAFRSGRLPQAQQARLEARRARAALDEAQYEVDVTASTLGKCNNAVGRFDQHIEPILTAMSPGRLDFPLAPENGGPVVGPPAEED